MRCKVVAGWVAVVAVEAVLLGLCGWQIARMVEKNHLAEQESQRTPMVLEGTWEAFTTTALDNQPNPLSPDKVGWRVLTAFHTPSGTVVVDRGWAPLPADRTAPPDLTKYTPSGITVTGVWASFPQRKGWLSGPDTTTHPRILAWLNPTLITSSTLGPMYLQATYPADAGLIAQPPAPPDGSRHASYALQWLVMALVFPILMWIRVRKTPKV
ncbi:MAG: SURF1 family protein [Alphaproteobacteria bacterium]